MKDDISEQVLAMMSLADTFEKQAEGLPQNAYCSLLADIAGRFLAQFPYELRLNAMRSLSMQALDNAQLREDMNAHRKKVVGIN